MKTKISKRAGVFVAVLILIVTVTTTIGTSHEMNITSTYKMESKAVSKSIGYDYQILWMTDWLDGDTTSTKGGKAITDSDNNVITYAYSGAINQDVLIKYDADGNLLWQVSVVTDDIESIESENLALYTEEPPMPLEYENYTNEMTHIESEDSSFKVHSILVDNNDNIILVCKLYIVNQEPPHESYLVIIKYDSDGNEFMKNAYDFNSFVDPGMDSAIDSDGNIFVPCFNIVWSYVSKLSSDGSVDWVKPVSIVPFWWASSLALDSNENPVVVSLGCLFDPEGGVDPTRFTKFDGDTGCKIADDVFDLPLRGTTFHDLALTIDTSDDSVYYGFIDYIYKIDASLNQVIWEKLHTCYVYDLKVADEKLIAIGGWCSVGDIIHYYGAVYNKNSGDRLLDMALGRVMYCSGAPFFQQYFNHLKGMSIDNNGDILAAGGQGGMKVLKFQITRTAIPSDISAIQCLNLLHQMQPQQ